MSRNMTFMTGVFAAFLSMILPAAVFGQDNDGTQPAVTIGAGELTFTGSLKTGLLVENDARKAPNADGDGRYAAKISPYSYDLDDGSGIQTQFNLGAEFANGPLGAKLNLRKNLGVQSDGGDFPDFEVSAGYCWFDFLEKKITVSAGLIDEGAWGTDALGGTASDTSYDAVNGLRVAVSPIDGLVLGAAWSFYEVERALGPTGGLDEDWVRNQPYGSWTYDEGFTFSELLGSTALGALYTTDLFGLSLSARFHPDYVAADYTHYRRGLDLLFGAKVKPISTLTVTVDGYVNGLGVNNDSIKHIAAGEGSDPADWNADWKYVTPRQVVTAAANYRINDKTTAVARFQVANTSGINAAKTELDRDEDAGSWNIRLQGAYKPTPRITTALRGQFNFKYKGKTERDHNDALSSDLKREDFTDFYLMPAVVLSVTKGLSIGFYDFLWFYTEKGWGNSYTDGGGTPQGFMKNALAIDLIMSF